MKGIAFFFNGSGPIRAIVSSVIRIQLDSINSLGNLEWENEDFSAINFCKGCILC